MKRDRFGPGLWELPAITWLRWRRTTARSKLTFSTEILEKLAETTERCASQIDTRCALLKECVGKLADKARRVLELRYEKGTFDG